MNPRVSLAALDRGLWAHLRAYPLPEPVSVGLHPVVGRVDIQPGGGRDDLAHLGELLLWAYTLDRVTASWWHTTEGSLHITVDGRTGGGLPVRVFGGIPFTTCVGLVPLALDEREGVSLDELHALRELLCEQRETSNAEAGGVAA